MHPDTLHTSVIVPVYNNPADLRECLSALLQESLVAAEIIVVDDASTDDSLTVAEALGVRSFRLPKNAGPAAARNYGASQARGKILLFVDADVVIAPGAIQRVTNFFEDHPDVAAVFGSYDAAPRATDTVSRYRNLLHHFVHQNSNPEASTFWAGCGAIRREVFDLVGGFNSQRYPRPSIEDIELGYRLCRRGFRILLDKDLQGTHLKRWTLRSVISTDVCSRAVPWARLILERKSAPKDLNLKLSQRLCGLLVMLAGALIIVGMFRTEAMALAAVVILAIVMLNRQLYVFFFTKHGAIFSAAGVLLHLLYFLYSVLSYMFVWAGYHFRFIAIEDSSVSKPSENA